jgi:hypothetical protein
MNLFNPVRGGSWYVVPKRCRSAYRGKLLPDISFTLLGFRVCRTNVCRTKKEPELYLRLLAFLRSVLYH